MKKIGLIVEFQKRFELPDIKWKKFLSEVESGVPLKDICKTYNVKYDATRYLFYSLSFDISSKAKRKQSVLELHKDLAKERGEGYDLVEELEKELTSVINKNRKLNKAITTVRDENNNLRSLCRKVDRQESLEEKVLEEFSNKISGMNFDKIDTTIKKIIKPTQEKGLILVLSDEHSGSVEKYEESNNNFNYSVAKNRIDYMIDKTINNPYQSNTLTVLQLLDSIQGIINGKEFQSEDGISTSILKIVEFYEEAYLKLAKVYDNIEVYVSGDNHSRTTQNRSTYMKWDNFSIMAFKFLEKILVAKGINNVKFNYTLNEYHFINMNNCKILACHSDTLRSYSPTSQSERSKIQSICIGLFNQYYNHCITGHIHKANACMNEYGGYNISNGTLVGNGAYGVTCGFPSIRPSQSILFLDELGNFEQISFIDLSHIQN